MNNLNMMLTICLGYMAMLSDKNDRKLLVIKIIEASKSLRGKIIVWLSQMARNKASRKNKTTTISPLKKTNLVFKKRTYRYVLYWRV